jgi:hypothetical protein
MRSRQPSQAIVEFGLIALLFVALMFATVDFGLLLNTWLAVSSGSREIARNASIGKQQPFLQDQARHLSVPSVGAQGFVKGFCCSPPDPGDPDDVNRTSSAIEVRVEYFNNCVPSPGTCDPIVDGGGGFTISRDYPYPDLDHHGSGPLAPACNPTACHPQPDDMVRVTVIAHGAQIITPLLRPAFGCTNGNNPNCYVPLTTSVIMRFEGQEF